MRYKQLIPITVVQTIIYFSFFGYMLINNSQSSYVVGSIVLQSGTLTPEPTPTPFLDPIFYGRNYTLKIFDHDLPLPSGNDNADDNFHVLH